MCDFSTTFTALMWQSLSCGVLLVAAAALLFWRTRQQQRTRSDVLIGSASLLVGLCALLLAFLSSRQPPLLCYGPLATAAQIQQSIVVADRLDLFEFLVIITIITTVVLAVFTAVRFSFASQRIVAARSSMVS